MEKNDCRRYVIRLNYDVPAHQRLIEILDDLNPEVHKSRNQFILNAINYYLDAMRDEVHTLTEKKEQDSAEKALATKGYVKEQVNDMEEKVRKDIYEDIIRFLGGAIINRSMADAFTQGSSGTGSEDCVDNREESYSGQKDIVSELDKYDNVLAQVMSWSDDE